MQIRDYKLLRPIERDAGACARCATTNEPEILSEPGKNFIAVRVIQSALYLRIEQKEKIKKKMQSYIPFLRRTSIARGSINSRR